MLLTDMTFNVRQAFKFIATTVAFVYFTGEVLHAFFDSEPALSLYLVPKSYNLHI